MKKYNLILTAAVMSLAFSCSSCSLFKSSDNSEGSGKGLKGWFESSKSDAKKDTEKIKDKASDVAGKIKDETQKIAADTENELDEIAGNSSGESLSGDWAIETVMGKKAVGETAPFIKFVPDEKRIYGNNGCNVLNATYMADVSKKTLSFANLATTMMLCADTNITDSEIGQALDATESYSVETGQTDQILTLYNAKKEVVMTLMHRDFHFLDGTWAVKAIDGEDVDIPDMKLALDVEEKRMHGNTGCNIINGELETDMDTANSISFSKIAMTRMACPNSGWETRMTVALEEAITAKKLPDDQIEFLGSNGQQVMLLQRTTPIEN